MTTTPPWGTPEPGEPLSTEPGWTTLPAPDQPGNAPVARIPEAGSLGFYLIVEQLTGSGDTAVWKVDPDPLPAGPTRQDARAAALHLARTFAPHHPFSPRGRTVYRVTADSLVVLVPGLTKTFHFRVSVAERMG